MSPERRKQYFNMLLNNGELSSNESINDADPRLSRATNNWSRLRTGWKDAVKAELSSGFDQCIPCDRAHQ